MCLIDVAFVDGGIVLVLVGAPYLVELDLFHIVVGSTFIVRYAIGAGDVEYHWPAVSHDMVKVELYIEDHLYRDVVESVRVIVNILEGQ